MHCECSWSIAKSLSHSTDFILIYCLLVCWKHSKFYILRSDKSTIYAFNLHLLTAFHPSALYQAMAELLKVLTSWGGINNIAQQIKGQESRTVIETSFPRGDQSKRDLLRSRHFSRVPKGKKNTDSQARRMQIPEERIFLRQKGREVERFSGVHILGCLMNSQEVHMTITSSVESGKESFWVCRKGL